MNIDLFKVAITLYSIKLLICMMFFTKIFYELETNYKGILNVGYKSYFVYTLEDRGIIGIIYIFIFWICTFPSIILSILIIKITNFIKKG